MDFSLKERPSFTVTGISVRTTNAGGQSQQDISELWSRFIREQTLQQIPGRINGEICCMYTDYESDHSSPYTVILGSITDPTIDLAENMVCKTVSPQLYRVYTSASASPEAVVATWMHIWQSDAKRSYAADFDLYKEDGSVETYVSVTN